VLKKAGVDGRNPSNIHARTELSLSHKKAQNAQNQEWIFLGCLCSFVATARQRALARAQTEIHLTTPTEVAIHSQAVISRVSVADLDHRTTPFRVGMTVAISGAHEALP
jgi:hypothetical protein